MNSKIVNLSIISSDPGPIFRLPKHLSGTDFDFGFEQ